VGALFFTLWEVGQGSPRIKGSVTRDYSTMKWSRLILFLLDHSELERYRDLASNQEQIKGKKSRDTFPLKSENIIASGVTLLMKMIFNALITSSL
jgi:hypothetical protein